MLVISIDFRRFEGIHGNAPHQHLSPTNTHTNTHTHTHTHRVKETYKLLLIFQLSIELKDQKRETNGD